ncbi:hypothetical protein [Halobaculum sp. D14]|uniref:hypothetical protein n=1 Tax=unclassified Halobaculum TaxID=2640896 RepID=UPI003EB8E625
MPSVALLAAGVVLVVAGGYGALYPQRQYEIRQWGQTTDDPELSEGGKLLWRLLDAALVLFGVGTLWLAFTA